MGSYYDRQGRPMEMMEWARAFEKDDRVIGATQVGEAKVSTVWLGLDHSWHGGPPLIFETMIFDGPHDGYQARYSTEEQAKAGHARVVAALERGEEP